MVIWIIGLSGAGKSTIGREVHRQWRALDPAVVFVDGDVIRQIFGHDTGADAYTVEGRRRNADRIVGICRWLDAQGLNVVCAILSIFEDQRRENRTSFSRYFEVNVRAPLETLMARDIKDLYRPAVEGRRSHVVGLDIAYAEPTTSDLVIENGEPKVDAAAAATQILRASGVLA